MTAVTAYMYW